MSSCEAYTVSGKDGEGLEKKQKHFIQAELPEKTKKKKKK